VIPRGGVALPNSRSDLGVPLRTVRVRVYMYGGRGGRGIKIESVYTVFGSCIRVQVERNELNSADNCVYSR